MLTEADRNQSARHDASKMTTIVGSWLFSVKTLLRRKRNMWEWPFGRVAACNCAELVEPSNCTLAHLEPTTWSEVFLTEVLLLEWWCCRDHFHKSFTNCLATSDVTRSLFHIDFFSFFNLSWNALSETLLCTSAVNYPDLDNEPNLWKRQNRRDLAINGAKAYTDSVCP